MILEQQKKFKKSSPNLKIFTMICIFQHGKEVAYFWTNFPYDSDYDKTFSFVNLNVGLYHFNVQESGTKKGRANIQDFAFHIFERMHTFFVEFAELQKSTEINYNTNYYGRRKKLNTKTFF